MGDHFTQRTEDFGDVDLAVEERAMHYLQVKGDGGFEQVEIGLAPQLTANRAVHVIEHALADGVFAEQLQVGVGAGNDRELRVVELVVTQQLQPQRGEHLQVQLLAQHHVLRTAGLGAAQARHERSRGFHASVLQGFLEAGQDELLDHVEQDVVARHLEAITETLFRHDVHVTAAGGVARPVQPVVSNDQIRGAATDVDGGQRDALTICLAGARDGVEKLFGVARKVFVHFGVEVHQLTARGLVPFHAYLGQRRSGRRGVLIVGVQFIGLPVQALPHQADGVAHAFLKDAALSLRHARRHGQGDAVQTTRHAGMALTRALGRAVDLHQRLRQHFGQHEGHQRAARITRHEHRQLLVRVEAVQRVAGFVNQVRKRGGRGERFLVGLDVGTVEAPAVVVGVLIPQIALGARQPGRPFSATAAAGQAPGLLADAGDGGPLERIVTAAFD